MIIILPDEETDLGEDLTKHDRTKMSFRDVDQACVRFYISRDPTYKQRNIGGVAVKPKTKKTR